MTYHIIIFPFANQIDLSHLSILYYPCQVSGVRCLSLRLVMDLGIHPWIPQASYLQGYYTVYGEYILNDTFYNMT